MAAITPANLDVMYMALSKAFINAFGEAPKIYEKIATSLPSSSTQTVYGWVDGIPGLREWIGDREISRLSKHSYSITNRKFESTFSVKAEDILDDALGMYPSFAQEVGRLCAEQPDNLLFEMIKQGDVQKCFDGTPFFGTHAVSGGRGKDTEVSNLQTESGKSGVSWMLLDTTRALKPFIWQSRENPRLDSMTQPSDHNVFMRDEYTYGARMRGNVGFGFWQMAFGSQKELTAENFEALYLAMTTQKRGDGTLLGVKPNLLLVGEDNRKAAFLIAQAATLADQQPNPNYNLVNVITTPRL